MSDLTDQQRDELAGALRKCRVVDAPSPLLDASDTLHVMHHIVPVVARMLAAAEQAGADRVMAAVDAVFNRYGDAVTPDEIRAVLRSGGTLMSVRDSSRVDQASTATHAVRSLVDPNHGRTST